MRCPLYEVSATKRFDCILIDNSICLAFKHNIHNCSSTR